MRSLHVGVAQIQSKAMDIEGNLERMHNQVKAAALSGVEVILFAETCIHAYCLYSENLALAEPLGGPINERLSAWAREYGMVVMAGMLEKSDLGIHNSHIIARPDGSVFSVRKHNLTEFEISARLMPGLRERTPFEINGVTCGLLICADTGIPGIYAEIREQGIELVFCPTAGGGYRKDYLTEADMKTAEGKLRYIDNRPRVCLPHALVPSHEFEIAIATANALGDDGAFMTHQGHCVIVDQNRVLRAQIQGTIVVDHFLDQMTHAVLYF